MVSTQTEAAPAHLGEEPRSTERIAPRHPLARSSWTMVALGITASAAFVLMEGRADAIIQWFVGGASLAGMVAGMAVNRPSRVRPWLLMAAGLVLFVAGDAVYYTLLYFRPGRLFPSPADAFYFGGYGALLVSLWLIGRQRRVRLTGPRWLDGIIVAASGILIVVVFILQPYGEDLEASLLWAVTLGYPLVGVAILPAMVHFGTPPLRQATSDRMLLAASTLLLASNIGYSVAVAHDASTFVGSWIGVGWLLAYCLLAAAALHPSVRAADPGTGDVDARVTSWRLLAVFSFVLGPIVLAQVAEPLWGIQTDGYALAIGSVVLTALMGVRIGAIVREDARGREKRARDEERVALMHEMTRLIEDERSRVASEIHDGPIQRLAELSLKLERARVRLSAGTRSSTLEIIERVQDELGLQVQDLRRVMTGLRPPVLDHRGLEAAIADLLEPISEEHGIGFRVRSLLHRRLSSELETALYRIAQESIVNAIKHAEPKTLDVLLFQRDGVAGVEVRDDGSGFSPEQVHSRTDGSHIGLRVMHERMAMLGGHFEVSSAPGAGTLIHAVVPDREAGP